jgi:tetratricopeptide (TPR) repeat protein
MSDLTRTLLSETLRELVRDRRSGVLVVSNSQVTKGVFLRCGEIVFASSTLEADKLGASLIRLGRIGRREFAEAYQATQRKGRRLGEELVKAGVLQEEELGRLVAHQARRIELSLFAWTDGDVVFEEAVDPIPADLALELPTRRLLFEGARIYPDAARLETALAPLNRRLSVVVPPAFDISQVPLSPAERQVLADAADGLPLSAMLAHPMPRMTLVKAVYALLAGGILEEAAGATRPDPVARGEGTFRIAMAEEARPAQEDPRERILHLYEVLPRASHYQVLGVAVDAELAAIQAAFKRLSDEEAREGRDLAGDVRMVSILSTLQLRRREALRVLSDPDLRRTYDRSLTHPPAGPPPGSTAESHARAKKLAVEATALLEQGQNDAAITLLLQAVEADPKAFPPRRALALALAHHATLHRKAERHFITALELQPGDVELRYRLALYYRKAGLPQRAILHLQVILSANPEHEGAIREWKALSGAGGTRP